MSWLQIVRITLKVVGQAAQRPKRTNLFCMIWQQLLSEWALAGHTNTHNFLLKEADQKTFLKFLSGYNQHRTLLMRVN